MKKMKSFFVPRIGDNFDKKYCEGIEKIDSQTKERYQYYMSKDKFKDLFFNYTFVKNDMIPTEKKVEKGKILNNNSSNRNTTTSSRSSTNNININVNNFNNLKVLNNHNHSKSPNGCSNPNFNLTSTAFIKYLENNNKNNNNRNNNNIVINPFNQNNFIDTNIKSDYSMIILNNNETLSVHVEKINSPSPYPIEFTIYIKNNNNNLTWPKDTILKCKNDNTDIFFYHCKWNQMKTNFNGEICYKFEIILNSKTKKITVGKYSCRFFLISDSKGRIGNNFGQINLNVFERIEDMNEDDNVFMDRYSVGQGKVEYGKI